MNLYLLVVIVGLLIKSATAVRFFTNCPEEHTHLRVELSVFFVVFIASSIVNLVIFAPLGILQFLNIPIEFFSRLYYVLDNLSTLVAAYLLLGMFGSKLHKMVTVVLLVVAYILISSYSVLFTDTHFDGLIITSYVTLAKQVPNNPFIIIPQILAFLPLLAVVVTLIRTYRGAKTNQSQIRNFYALIAFILFNLSYISSIWAGLDNPIGGMVLATRGFFFFFVITLTLLSNDFFDIRHITPKTVENHASVKIFKLFRYYSNEKIGHKEAVREMEKIMVEYKLTKIIGFKDDEGSALPIVADSMKISRSGLYDVLKRLGISPPKSNKD